MFKKTALFLRDGFPKGQSGHSNFFYENRLTFRDLGGGFSELVGSEMPSKEGDGGSLNNL